MKDAAIMVWAGSGDGVLAAGLSQDPSHTQLLREADPAYPASPTPERVIASIYPTINSVYGFLGQYQG
jgi:hypothetical protein